VALLHFYMKLDCVSGLHVLEMLPSLGKIGGEMADAWISLRQSKKQLLEFQAAATRPALDLP